MLTSLVNWSFWASPVELSALVEVQAATGKEQNLFPLMEVIGVVERKNWSFEIYLSFFSCFVEVSFCNRFLQEVP